MDPYTVDFFFEKGAHLPSTFEDLGNKSIFLSAQRGEQHDILCFTKPAWLEEPGKF